MGAICCLEKAWLSLLQGSSQNDGRKGQTFFRGVKERGDRTSQDRRSAKREFLQAEIQECFERPAYLYKNQHAMGYQLSQKLGLLTNHQFQISKSVSFLSLVDMSIFMRLSWLVLVHLCRVSLVILMFKVIFVCFQILWTKYARRCILEAFGACFGLGMDSKCMGQVDGRI